MARLPARNYGSTIAQRAALTKAIERGPTPELNGVVRWRLCDLVQWLWLEFRVSVNEQTLSRKVRATGDRQLRAPQTSRAGLQRAHIACDDSRDCS
ncbi:hypothetical protein CDO26_21820 (plasmid) [Sinorhizobium meliloti]|nr:hypothetical protein CDO26_21820 [Sinorhizobium meliloti]